MNKVTSPLVSVIIPNYNHAQYLGRALQSVLDQTYTHWEAIVIDNHSTDNSDEVTARFIDPRITYLKIHNNGVIAASRNAGILVAKGDWIAFLDSDDYWYPGRLEVVINGIKHNKTIDVFSTNEIQVDLAEGRSRLLRYGPFCKNFYKTLLIEGNKVSTSATLVRYDFLKVNAIIFRESSRFVTVEDYDFWMLLAKAGAKFYFILSVQGEATIHSDNTSGQTERHKQNLVNLLKDHVYNIQDFQADKEKLWSVIYAQYIISVCKTHIASGQYMIAMELLKKAFQLSIKGSLKYIITKSLKKANHSPWQTL
jgi:glycosyltransferase involved in cell wall biosynthesis